MMKEEAAAPPQGQEGAPAEGGEGGGSPAEAIASIAGTVNEGLMMLDKVFSQLGGVPPEAKKKFQMIAQGFQQVVSEIMGGGGQAPQGEGGAAPMESGGAEGAVPADPARY